MQKITPCIWFDDKAEEAADFYISVFNDGKIKIVARYTAETPSKKPVGSVMTVLFEIEGMEFLALNGGPIFKPNPSISFFVNRQSAEEVEALWDKLSEGGQALMPLDSYPFSEKYGWVQDKYGLSWQVNLSSDEPGISTFLLFVGDQCGRAEEAAKFYTGLLPQSAIGEITRYDENDEGPDEAGTVKTISFTLGGQKFMALNSAYDHKFQFDEGISLIINCDTQDEVDTLWDRITADGGAESVCGWCKDRFGGSWQIVPVAVQKMLTSGDTEATARMMDALLKMKKLDIAALERAFAGG
jgi:predicted 3-demethylubiquinone-9 3-methyltransferase (glyoxalase superfamily)